MPAEAIHRERGFQKSGGKTALLSCCLHSCLHHLASVVQWVVVQQGCSWQAQAQQHEFSFTRSLITTNAVSPNCQGTNTIFQKLPSPRPIALATFLYRAMQGDPHILGTIHCHRQWSLGSGLRECLMYYRATLQQSHTNPAQGIKKSKDAMNLA